MSNDPLPQTLDIRKAAARDVTVSGALNPADLPRFQALLADGTGAVEAELAFALDEENRPIARLKVAARVLVACQRCLRSMPLELAAGTVLGIVWNDNQARQLPRELDPLIVPEEGCNLWELVEDELILALPAYSYHETEDCKQILSAYAGPPAEREAGSQECTPFAVLARLKAENTSGS